MGGSGESGTGGGSRRLQGAPALPSTPAVDVSYGTAISIDIDFDDNIWVSNDKGFVYKQEPLSTTWTKVEHADHVSQIRVNPTGQLIKIKNTDKSINKYDLASNTWSVSTSTTLAGKRISIGITNTWFVADDGAAIHEIGKTSETSYVTSSAIDVGVGLEGSVFALLAHPLHTSVTKLFKLVNGAWLVFSQDHIDLNDQSTGTPRRVVVDYKGNPIVIFDSGIIQYFDGYKWYTR